MPRRPRTTPRKQPRQERAKFTVAALLDATAHVLVKDGYDGASTNRIALAAGVNIGSLYQYFPGKEALVAALIDRHLEEISRVIVESLASVASAPLPVAVRAVVRAHLRAHATDIELHRALIEQIPRVERLNPIVRFRLELVEMVHAWLVQRKSELRVRDVRFAAFALVNLVDALTQEAIFGRAFDMTTEHLASGIAEIALRYLEGP